MGNSNTCCVYDSKQNGRAHPEDHYAYHPPTAAVTNSTNNYQQSQSSNNLQHISDREPEDVNGDPSLHPSMRPIFLIRSKSELQKQFSNRRRSQYENHQLNHVPRLSKKYSSCSTIYIDDSTVSQPNLKNTIKAVALAIYFHMKNRERRSSRQLEGHLLEIFDERCHPLAKDAVPEDYSKRDPEHKSIYRFIRTLFHAAQLTAECAIVTLVYLERLLTCAEIEIVPSNWKRMVLGAIMLASKVWDDQAVWNVDYCQILKHITVEDMNELERQFLELLQFNINIPSSVYAKYYFDLRALADAHNLSFPLEPLSKERAQKLEAMSNLKEEKFKQPSVRRSHSLNDVNHQQQGSRSKAIIS